MRDEAVGAALVDLALASIRHGLRTGRPLTPALDRLSAPVTEPGACFVTLTRDGLLRGCVGNLRPQLPLAEQVATSAFHAAFRDPRMSPVQADELDAIDIAVSVLSALEPIDAQSEDELAHLLTPSVHGLLAEHPTVRATFLPKVWRDLPEPAQFLAALKNKAGLGEEGWPPGTRFFRYTTTDYGERGA